MTDWKARAEALADELVASDAIRSQAWRAVFATTPRHLFVPRFYALDEFNQPRHMVDGTDPDRRGHWLEAIYQDRFLVTHFQVIGSMPDGREVRAASSSASMPRVVAKMLDRLDVADGHRMLEIGTGTGYNAALLAARVGDGNVTSIELDETTAAEAAEHLAAAGYKPTLVVGDGAAGHSGQAPYDRIIATCAVDRIPRAWIDQLAPGGRIVAPLTFGSALVVLDRDEHGLAGRIDVELASFMAMRPSASQAVVIRRPDAPPQAGLTEADPQLPDPTGPHHDFRLWLRLHQPCEVNVAVSCEDDGTPTGVILNTEDSYAEVAYIPTESGLWPVTQLGATRLWDTVEAAWRSWQRYDRPERTRIGISARADGEQWAWLDQPEGSIRWPLPTC